ncbi:MAG: HD domain-containing phosphohydrolase [Pirellulales bacterium]
MTNPRVLLVDDERLLVEAVQRHIRRRFDVHIATRASEAFDILAQQGPFAVVVSDMKMPGMDGIQFLAGVKESWPDATRIMLTGLTDVQTAINAVNDGHVFRFLTKPCPADILTAAIEAGAKQYELITSERELLSKTLGGAVSLLTQVLSLVNPEAFGRAARARETVRQICTIMAVGQSWEIEMAAMLSQVGCVAAAEEPVRKAMKGEILTPEEQDAYAAHIKIGHDLVDKIPRLGNVAKCILYQDKRFDGSGYPADDRVGPMIPLGGRMLKAAIDLDALVSGGTDNETALATMERRRGWYDPTVFAALEAVANPRYEIRNVRVLELDESMTFDEHVVAVSGDVLVAGGQRATAIIRERLCEYAKTCRSIREPIRVRIPQRVATSVARAATANAETGTTPTAKA